MTAGAAREYAVVALCAGHALANLVLGLLAMQATWAAMRCRAPGVSRWRAARAIRWVGSLAALPVVFEPMGVRHARRAVQFGRWQLAALAAMVLLVLLGGWLGR